MSAVVTHAGITSDWWFDVLEGEVDARQAVTKINAASLEDIHRPGEMLPIGDGMRPPGPVWASTAELWSSWLDQPAPWPQVHGHSSSWNYQRHTWSPWTPEECIPFAAVDEAERRSRYLTGRGVGASITGIDNSVFVGRKLEFRPFVVANATVG